MFLLTRAFSDNFSAFESKIVTIVAGTGLKQRIFTAHEAVLKPIKFFAARLSTDSQKGQNNHIRLEADDVEVVECLLEYAYTGRIDIEIDTSSSGIFEDLERSQLMLFTKTYIVASKYCWEECQNYVMDRLRSHYSENVVCSCTLAELELADVRDSKLRQLLILKVACALAEGGYKDARVVDANLSPFIRNGGAIVEELLEASIAFSSADEEDRHDPTKAGTPCDWHVHITTPKCQAVDNTA